VPPCIEGPTRLTNLLKEYYLLNTNLNMGKETLSMIHMTAFLLIPNPPIALMMTSRPTIHPIAVILHLIACVNGLLHLVTTAPSYLKMIQ
jgi:hypothetical protein